MPKKGNPPLQGELLQGTLDLLILKTLAARSRARPHHRARDRAPLRRRPPGRARLPLPGPAPAGGPRLDRVLLGHVREQPARALLPAHARRPQAAGGADQPLGRPRARDRPRPAPGLGSSNELDALLPPRAAGTRSARASCSRTWRWRRTRTWRAACSPDEARDAARRKLGEPLRIREEIYLMNTRRLHRHRSGRTCATARASCASTPGFAAVAILSLALGVGANTRDLPAPRTRCACARCRWRTRRRWSRSASPTARRPHGRVHRPLPAAHESAVGADPRRAQGFSALAAWGTARSTSPTAARRATRRPLGERRVLRDAGVRPAAGRLLAPGGRRAAAARRPASWSAMPSGSASWAAMPPPSAARCAWTAIPSRSWASRARRLLRGRGRAAASTSPCPSARSRSSPGPARSALDKPRLVVPDRARAARAGLDGRARDRAARRRSRPGSSRRRSRRATPPENAKNYRALHAGRLPARAPGSRACAATTRSRSGSCSP